MRKVGYPVSNLRAVTLSGFEPETSASVVRCSIQLSYRAKMNVCENAYSFAAAKIAFYFYLQKH